MSEHTRVHGVGDGAEWILTQFQEQSGSQGNYLVDFYHVSQNLAAAVICPKHPKAWWHRQRGPLLENKVAAVVRALAAHLEAEDTPESPVARRIGMSCSGGPIWTTLAPAHKD